MQTLYYSPQEDDYVKAFRAYYQTSWKWWWVIPIVLIIPILILRFVFDYDVSLFIWPFVILLFGDIFLTVFLFVIIPCISAKQIMESDLVSDSMTIEYDDERIRFIGKMSDSYMEWNHFNRVIETRDLFMLIYSTNMNCLRLLPKRIFDSEKEMIFFGP
jgi:hypothetical protein